MKKLKLEKFKILSMRNLHYVKGGSDTDPMGPVSTSNCNNKTGEDDEDGEGV